MIRVCSILVTISILLLFPACTEPEPTIEEAESGLGIEVSPEEILFQKGDPVCYRPATVTNTGTRTLEISWTPEGVVQVEGPSQGRHLRSGSAFTYMLTTDCSTEGSHSVTFHGYDLKDAPPDSEEQFLEVSAKVSVKVVGGEEPEDDGINTGYPCESDEQCNGGDKDAFCARIEDISFCYVPDCESEEQCGDGNGCFGYEDEQGRHTVCLPRCTDSDQCRDGFVCVDGGACVPRCHDDTGCSEGFSCDQDSGKCQ
jgi:hypothetical protein